MLNRYSVWKNIALIAVVFISVIYALPNIYKEIPTIQINGVHDIIIDEQILDQVRNIFTKKNIKSKSIVLKNNTIIASFTDIDTQLHAKETLVTNLRKQYIVTSNLVSDIPYWLRLIGGKSIKLGLDLRGGTYFLIEVDVKTILTKLQEKNINILRNDLHKKGFLYSAIRKADNYVIEIYFRDSDNRSKAESYLKSQYHDLVFIAERNKMLSIVMTDKLVHEEWDYAVFRNIDIIRNRINQLGIIEALVQRQGDSHIIVELPGIQNAVLAKEILGATATLEFRLVNANIDLSDIKNGYIPDDSEVKYTCNGIPVVLYKRIILTGDHIINAVSNIDETGNSQITISLDSIGSSVMSNFTHDNQDKLMATLFIEYKNSGKKDSNGHYIFIKNEKIINVARISDRFSNKFCITGIHNSIESRRLSLLLRAGVLIAPIQIIEEYVIGSTLGSHDVKQVIKASLAALLVSMIFMIIYYRKFGIITSLILLSNLIFIVGIMSLLPEFILTVPGIVSMVLAFTIAIDANVLINECIKEELKNSRLVQQAIHKGHKRAFSSILDANLTTAIIAIILYTISTGFIKSFAIITIIGIVTSMFTSIIVVRSIINLLYGIKHTKSFLFKKKYNHDAKL